MILDFLQLIYESLRPVNLPLTMLLCATVLYWLLVMFGMADLDLFDGDGIGLDIGGDDGGGGHADGDHGGGIFRPITQFLAVGEVPTTIILSFMIASMWFGSLLLNHFFNDGYFWKAGLLLIPNLIGATLITGLISLPLRKVMRKFNKGEAVARSYVGQECLILSLQADSSYGQAELPTEGAPLVISVRTEGDEVLKKGDLAIIQQENRASGIFTVTKATKPIPQDKIC